MEPGPTGRATDDSPDEEGADIAVGAGVAEGAGADAGASSVSCGLATVCVSGWVAVDGGVVSAEDAIGLAAAESAEASRLCGFELPWPSAMTAIKTIAAMAAAMPAERAGYFCQ